MNKENKVLVKQNETNSVDLLLNKAVEKGASVEVLERLFMLHEKVQASKAKSAFTVAMSDLQGKLPIVRKLKQGHAAAFAPIEDVLDMTKEVIKKSGFSYRWDTVQKENEITVSCIATHIQGHSETTSMTSETEEVVKGNTSGKATKSAPQRAASTITFLKRYTFINMFGIILAGEDFDGRSERQSYKTKKVKKTSVEELMSRAIKKIEQSKTVLDVANVDKYVEKDKQKFCIEFKEKIKKLATKRIEEIKNKEYAK